MTTSSALPRSAISRRGLPTDRTVLSTWALTLALVLYLGISGGGYDPVVHSQVGVVVWWVVLVGAAWGLLPAARIGRAGWMALALLAAFLAWSAIAMSWSLSSERTLAELSRVATYLGILLLALAVHRDRERAMRHTVGALSVGVVMIAVLALISRLVPDSFTAAHQTAAFLGGAQARLNWPLNYWNGLGAFMAFGVPLLLGVATSARTLRVQAAAAAALPVVALCGYLTFSRGAAGAAALALIGFLAIAPERIPKLASAVVASAGSAILIAAAAHRSAIENGLYNHAAAVQGRQIIVAIVLVCAGVALAQAGVGLAARHGTLPALLRVPVSRARIVAAVATVVVLATALAAGAPSWLSQAWNQFKGSSTVPFSDISGRFGSLSSTGRYHYWQVIVHALNGRAAKGWGPGTFQLVWLPRAGSGGYVTNAHSLYMETLNDVGLVGLVLLIAFLIALLAAAVRAAVRTEPEARTLAAASFAALVAFCASAAVEWLWQLPVAPAGFLLVGAAVLAPAAARTLAREAASAPREAPPRRLALRLGMIAAAVACLVAIAIPLASTIDLRFSQRAVAAGNLPLALSDARAAAGVEPGAASPRLQQALVLEAEHDLPAALIAARRAVGREPQNSVNWLILSRIEAESGRVNAAIFAYRRARALDPGNPIFSG